MVIFNYNNLYRRFNSEIMYYAKQVDYYDCDDEAQDIRLYMWKHIHKFDPTKASLRYYVHLIVLTGFRRVIFDKTKQNQFEDSFSGIINESPHSNSYQKKNYPMLIEKILNSLSSEREIVIFYAILYNEEKKYTTISKLLNMNYATFTGHVKIIREKISNIIENTM